MKRPHVLLIGPPKRSKGLPATWLRNGSASSCRKPLRLDDLPINAAPYRLLEKETLHECYELFSLLNRHTAYVTSLGRLVGVVSLRELKTAVEGCVKGTLPSRAPPHRCESQDQEEKLSGKTSAYSSTT